MPAFARAWFLVIAVPSGLFASACGGPSSHAREPNAQAPGSQACPSERPTGTRTDYTPPRDLPEITVAEPQSCERGEAYIRVERATGARKLGTARNRGTGGFDEGCTTLPADPSDASQCPVINVGTILQAAVAELRRRNVTVNGLGGGPCARTSGDYEAWNFSLGVTDWRAAETAVRVVADVLARYDVAGYTGVAVRGIKCVVLL